MKQLTTLQEFKETISKHKKVVVDFYAQWCGPCKRISPQIEELSKKHSDILFVKVDVDVSEDIAEEYNISSLPTFMFFLNGKEVAEQVTGASIDAVKKNVEKL